MPDSDREQGFREQGFRATHDLLGEAAQGLAVLRRLVPAPDHGAGFRRDPETGFVYYSSEWLSDDEDDRWFSKPWNERDGDIPPSKAPE